MPPPGYVCQIERLALPLVEQRAEFRLPEHPRQLIVGAEIRCRQRGKSHRVETGRFTGSGEHLPGPVNQERRAGIGLAQQTVEQSADSGRVFLPK